MINAFTCGILSDLILSEFYEHQRLGKVCRSYRISYVYRFKYFIHIGSLEYRLKVILVQHYYMLGNIDWVILNNINM